MKHLYIVKNITSGEANSPSVFRKDGVIGADTYTLLKKDNSEYPTGEYLYLLSQEEYKAVNSLPIFTPVCYDIRDYKRYDKDFCSEIILQFQSDAGALSKTDTNSLLSLLGGVLEFLNINSPHHAYTELQLVTPNALFPQVLKDKYLAILDEYLKKYPRV